MTLMERRRALMAVNPWTEVQFSKSAFNKDDSAITVSYSLQTDTISVKQKTAGKYKSGDAPFTTESGYEYKIVCKYTAISGAARIGIRSSSYSFLYSSEWSNAPAAGEFSVVFPHDGRIAMVSLMSSGGTSIKGEVNYTELTIYRRKI